MDHEVAFGTLMELLEGTPPSGETMSELVEHMAKCETCCVHAAIMAAAIEKVDPTTEGSLLLQQFGVASQQVANNEERIGAYAECVVANTVDYANAQYPELAAHLQECPACNELVNETIAFLQEG